MNMQREYKTHVPTTQSAGAFVFVDVVVIIVIIIVIIVIIIIIIIIIIIRDIVNRWVYPLVIITTTTK